MSSSKAVVRRSVAQSLVITCQSSRVPLTLLRYLLHLILSKSNSGNSGSYHLFFVIIFINFVSFYNVKLPSR
ncbi:unnamed protein product [Schistosoma mattheei]|uniref:Uncharacterized protein n=1 Tax=Schistosoma mattheei TaxID=31246 RepID=A0A3P8K464_9TREM|nr:unnamed protein product [Schistosoma mattheei]